MQVINTAAAPQAIGPYSQAIVANGLVFVSGQIPLDPANGELVVSDIEVQTRRVFDNLAAVLQAAGGSFATLTKLTIYLVDLEHFAKVNAVMTEYCREPFPARACVQVAALPRGAMVEVDAIALTL